MAFFDEQNFCTGQSVRNVLQLIVRVNLVWNESGVDLPAQRRYFLVTLCDLAAHIIILIFDSGDFLRSVGIIAFLFQSIYVVVH